MEASFLDDAPKLRPYTTDVFRHHAYACFGMARWQTVGSAV
jgi:hypothetical protein